MEVVQINTIMSQFKINSITDKSGTSNPVIAGVSTNNSTGCMIIPGNPTEHRGKRKSSICWRILSIPHEYRHLDTLKLQQ